MPQIFFGDTSVGGASELAALLATDAGAASLKEAADGKDPSQEKLALPLQPPARKQAKRQPTGSEVFVVGRARLSAVEVVSRIQAGLPIVHHRLYSTVHKNCFESCELVEYFSSGYSLARQDAVEFCQMLLNAGIVALVQDRDKDGAPAVFADTPSLCRLHMHAETHMLNTWRQWRDRVDEPSETMAFCWELLSALQSVHTDNQTGLTDYTAIGEDPGYPVFQEAVCEFQTTDLAAMPRDARVAFVINLYNLLILHAFVQLGAPKTGLQRSAFFVRVGYDVGGHHYSFNDLENGILRSNAIAPYHFKHLFGKGDPRLGAVLEEPEMRIHFALNCGASSCPPISFFTAAGIDAELEFVAKSFLESDEGCLLDESTRTVTLSKIMSWYSRDFGKDTNEVLSTVARWLPETKKQLLQQWLDGGKPIKLKYFRYDWAVNASSIRPFNSAETKTRASACVVS